MYAGLSDPARQTIRAEQTNLGSVKIMGLLLKLRPSRHDNVIHHQLCNR